MRRYTVFNAEQTTGLPEAEPPPPAWEAVRRAERVLKISRAEIRHTGQNMASCDILRDRITLPHREQFREGPAYYQSAMHELGHRTGHPDRLTREIPLRGMREGPRSGAYAREDLRAEIKSMITGAAWRWGTTRGGPWRCGWCWQPHRPPSG
ncbi:MAG: zincin-like metallopeptidase domain-containing protein [Bryobacterales bacterium]|nr:zincin-like metallopeptidase domain-containing protein [Bryobacterales bacterium]